MDNRRPQRKSWVTIKNTLLSIKPSFKLIGSLFSMKLAIGSVVAGTVIFAAGDVLDPFEEPGAVLGQTQGTNILQEINNKLDVIINTNFSPGQGLPEDFRAQVDAIEARALCIAQVLDGEDVTCGD